MLNRPFARRRYTPPPPPPRTTTASPKADRGFTGQSVQELFLRTETVVSGVRKSAAIQSALVESKAELNALAKLLTKTRALFPDPQPTGPEPLEPTDEQREALSNLGRAVGKYRKTARRALAEQPELLAALGLG